MSSKYSMVFVYNADSGIFNTVSDIAHKIFAPESYPCNLCAITYGNFSMRAEWKEYLESLGTELEFLHRDQLAGKYGLTAISLPAVLLKDGVTLKEWITADEINRCGSLQALELLISERLSNLGN